MDSTTRASDRTRSEGRTLALLKAAAAVFPAASATRDWLHTPREELGGLTPAGAAWTSADAGFVAALLLTRAIAPTDVDHRGTDEPGRSP